MLSDSDLMARVRGGDAGAFELLYKRYGAQIRRHLARFVHAYAPAEDLLQEAFLRVWTRGEQWDGRGSFKAWLYRIATNLALNHLRSLRRRREQPLSADVEWSAEGDEELPAWLVDESALGPDTVIERAEQQELLKQLVTDLPVEKREVLHLVHEMEMSIRDAAGELGIPEGTAKSRLHYARARLAREWQGLKTEWEGS